MATAVVQVYTADPTSANTKRWNKRCTGVLTFIKDSSKRSHYFRVYSLKVGTNILIVEIFASLQFL